jgi:hypothetical protein
MKFGRRKKKGGLKSVKRFFRRRGGLSLHPRLLLLALPLPVNPLFQLAHKVQTHIFLHGH